VRRRSQALAAFRPACHRLSSASAGGLTDDGMVSPAGSAALGLERSAWRSLMLANVFGLAYVRLQDVWPTARRASCGARRRRLATRLLGVGGQYGDLFGPAFWDWFRLYLSQWIGARWSQCGAVGFP
jgi:hypothetical protein